MSLVYISKFTPSKYGDGDRWRVEIDGEWYDAYLNPAASAVQPGDHEVEFKTSPKTGKHYIVAIDGMYRTSRDGAPRQAPSSPPPGDRPPPVGRAPTAGPALPAAAPHQRDMWIFAAGLANHIIAAAGPEGEWTGQRLTDLARNVATAARAAARVFDGAAVDSARAAIAPPAAPAAARRPNPPQPEGDPEDPRNFGSDPGEPVGGVPFDDDIPF
jgi:hypothetical protein